jgi:hypothetical protein
MNYKFISVEPFRPSLASPLQIYEFGYVTLGEKPEEDGMGFSCKEGKPLKEKAFSRFHLCLNDDLTAVNTIMICKEAKAAMEIIESDYQANHQLLPEFTLFEFNDFITYYSQKEKLKLNSIFDCYRLLVSDQYPKTKRPTTDEAEMMKDISQAICKKYQTSIINLIAQSNARKITHLEAEAN